MSRLRVVCPFLVMIAFSAVAAAAISGWYVQSNPTTATLNDIQAIDANTAFAVGANGTILKTIDGGQTWTKLTSGTTDTLSAVYFLDASNGWAAGKSTVLKTTDGGTTWASQTVSAGGIEAIAFPSASVGVAVGYIGSQGFLRTADGGAIWTQVDVGNSGSNRPQDVIFIDALHGWAVGMNASSITTTCDPFSGCYTNYSNPKTRMWSTSDGGATWTTRTFASAAWLYGVSFVDANNGWVVGDNGLMWKTTDGGATWNAHASLTIRNLYAVDFADASNGWVVGAYGEIQHTADGGDTWTTQVSGTALALNAIDFTSATTGWAVGSVILRTDNGGPCTTLLNPTSASISAAGESRTIAVTTDAGCAWTAVSNDPWISITSGSSGSGNGTVNYTVEANGGAARQGSIEIAGLPFRILQVGAGDELTIRHLAGGASARFRLPRGIAVDAQGNVYVADSDNHTIRRISPAGVVTTVAGRAGTSGSADGGGSDARFNGPRDVEVDGSGNVYIADTFNHTIRMMTPSGVVTTLAGAAGVAGSDDGTGSAARFNNPRGVAVDASGNVFVADTDSHTIRKVTLAGLVTTVAGSAGISGSADGTAGDARFADPERLAVDAAGNLYVADSTNSTIRKVTPAGVVTTLAGFPGLQGSTDGTGSGAFFNRPGGVAVDSAGNVYVGDTFNSTIRKVTPEGVVTTLAGSALNFGSVDGTGSAARFYDPRGVAVDAFGNVYVADPTNQMIRKVTPDGVVTTLAGEAGTAGSSDRVASSGTADGTGTAARFNYPQGVAVGGSGNAYVADMFNHTIRKVTAAGVVTTLAGTAGTTGSADGTGAAALFNYPTGVAVDGSGNVCVADRYNYAIRKITPEGVVSTFAGGSYGTADGTGSAAQFKGPGGVVIASNGDVYVADTYNHTIRKITPDAAVTTFAGTAGSSGSADGTGNAARFNSPNGLAMDGGGNIYIADTGNHTVRKITSGGEVTTVAGVAGLSGAIDGLPGTARFNNPGGVAVDSSGNIYVADTNNHAIRLIQTSGLVVTTAGLAGTYGFADGKGSVARFYFPSGIAVDSAGGVYVTDNNNAIRTTAAHPPPSITSIAPDSGAASGGTAVTISGSGFVEGATVRFGSSDATGVIVNPTAIGAMTPAGSGVVDVTVANPDGPSATLPNAFTYIPPPTVTSITPASGPAIGGTAFTISGSGFVFGATVRFGLVNATPMFVASPIEIQGIAPAGSGVVDVTVTNPDGQSATLPNAFTYTPAPAITSCLPVSGPTTGGTSVTISGSGFLPLASVRFGSAYATGVGVTSTAITATTPTGTGVVDVTVMNPDGQSATLSSAFTYIPAPTISSCSPASGPSTGGTAVTIIGSNFVAGATLRFGSAYATGVGVTSTSITATTPAGSGVVGVTVTNPDGQSITLNGGFTYEPAPMITSISPASGMTSGGTAVTISGANFVSGATASLGGAPATSVVVVSSGTITGTTPAHAEGAADVAVQNPDGQAGVLAGAFTYTTWARGDVNGDGTVGTADLIYLINRLFANGPAPVGSGDVDGDGNIDINDVFYLVNYLFAGGAAP